MAFQFELGTKVVFGNGSVSEIGNIALKMNAKKAFIVCDEGVEKAGIVDKIRLQKVILAKTG